MQKGFPAVVCFRAFGFAIRTDYRFATIIQSIWFDLIIAAKGKAAETAAKQLKEGIIAANELFKMSEYVLSDELSLVDCTLGPLLWRLPHYGVKLGKPGASVEAYAHRIFSRQSFKTSLTQAERDLVLSAA